MKLSEICNYLDSAIPLSFQEGYDNSGLQVGDPQKEISSALLAVDVTGEVLDEAHASGCDLVISHHPLIFGGLKKLTGGSYTERTVAKAIREGIAVYSAHTNLDAAAFGVSRKMAAKLGLDKVHPLVPLKNMLLKLVTFVPETHLVKVREAVFAAGAGVTGKYDRCAFTSEGTGSFRGGPGTNPLLGKQGVFSLEKEIRFETVLYSQLRKKVIKALLEAHPYEEVAYDIYSLENETSEEGMGCLGELIEAIDETAFLDLVAGTFSSRGLRYSALNGRMIKKVALCGGAGASLTGAAIAAGADAFVTADIKYHSFFDADGKILLADAGHYETEKFSSEILYDLIIKKFPKFAVRFSGTNTNPINYL